MNSLMSRARTALIAGAIFFACYICGPLVFGLLLSAIFISLLTIEWLPLCNKINRRLIAVTPIYPVVPMISILYTLSYYESSFLLPLYPFLMAWAGDTGAYITGTYLGKHKICPTISPKKTWEGLAGGFMTIFMVNILFLGYDSLHAAIFIPGLSGLIFFSLVMTIAGFLGDIAVSWLKRRAHVKDTGDLLPGHGGFLDRFDSLFCIILFFLIFI